MGTYTLTVFCILAVLVAWVLVQSAARKLSARHPELGPHREEGRECCGGCAGACRNGGHPH